MLVFRPMPRASQKHCFKLWKKENLDETGLAEYKPGFEWFFVIDDSSKNIVGFVAFIRHETIPTTLEQLYVYPQYRRLGLSVAIRQTMVAEFNLGALSIGKFIDNPAKLGRHRIVAEKSGFRRHHVIGVANGYSLNIHGDVFLRDDLPADVYRVPFFAMTQERYHELKKHLAKETA